MYPVLFEIPGIGFPLRTFGVLVAAGFLVGIWLWGRFLARYGVDPKNDPLRASQVGMWLLVGVLGGARLLYCTVEVSRYLDAELSAPLESYLENPQRLGRGVELSADDLALARRVRVGYDFLHDPIKVLFIWEGGLVMYGGFFGAALLGLWSSRRHGLHAWNALDTGLAAAFFGQAIGRFGCLFVGDDYGSVVGEKWRELPFPLTITVPAREWLDANPESLFDSALAGEVLWATQVWMSVNALLIGLVGWWLLSRRPRHGIVAAWILVHYSVTRFAIESFRGDAVRGVWFDGAISTSQLIAIPGVLVGLVLLVKLRRAAPRREPDPSGAASSS